MLWEYIWYQMVIIQSQSCTFWGWYKNVKEHISNWTTDVRLTYGKKIQKANPFTYPKDDVE